jgi:hypothetical protein
MELILDLGLSFARSFNIISIPIYFSIAVVFIVASMLIRMGWQHKLKLKELIDKVSEVTDEKKLTMMSQHELRIILPDWEYLQAQWDEFAEGFVEKNGAIHNTEQSASFFTDEGCEHSIGFQRISIRLPMLRSLPGIATGLGLLGTFIGISAGLGHLDTSAIENLQAGAIAHVIKSLSTAFWTSIAGVFCALLINFASQLVQDGLLTNLHKFRERLDRAVPLLTPESILERIDSNSADQVHILKELLEESKESRDNLQTIANDLADQMGEQFNTALGTHLAPQLAKITEIVSTQVSETSATASESVRRFTDEAMQQFTSSLQSSFQEMSSQVNGASERFEDVSRSFGEIMQTSVQSAQAHREMLEQGKQTVEASLQSFGQAKDHMQDLTQFSDRLSAALDALVERQSASMELNGRQAEIQTQAGQQISELAGTLGTFNREYGAVGEKLGEDLDDFEEQVGRLTRILTGLNANTQSASEMILQASKSLTSRSDQERQLLDGFVATSRAFQSGMEAGLPVAESLENVSGQLINATQSLASQQEHSQEVLAAYKDVVLDTYKDVLSHARAQNEAIQRNFDETNRAIEQGAAHMADVILSTANWSKDTQSALAAYRQELRSGLEEWGALTQNELEKFGGTLAGSLSDTLHKYDKELAAAVNSLKGPVGEMADIADGLAEFSRAIGTQRNSG